MNNQNWNEIDEVAEREGTARRNAFRSAAIPPKAVRGGVFRTTRGVGAGAKDRPASGGFERYCPDLPEAA